MLQQRIAGLLRRITPINFLLADFYTPAEEAVAEIKRRREDPEIFHKVDNFLKTDLPDHFSKKEPVFYLSRFLATPNLELKKVSTESARFDLKLIVGEDTESKFVPDNELKLPLGKLPLIVGVDKNGNDIIEYKTIIDFSSNQGKPLSEIMTESNKLLVTFHRELFNRFKPSNTEIGPETEWVNRHHRDDILEQYKCTMAIMCVYGMQYECFTPEEYQFFRENVYPAFKYIERIIGVRPLIIEHITAKEESDRNWNAYPREVSDFIKTITNK
tara:strand:- start:26495 stop:27310 length:816 start_codon:yes stop_codon:yes gene_type:complete